MNDQQGPYAWCRRIAAALAGFRWLERYSMKALIWSPLLPVASLITFVSFAADELDWRQTGGPVNKWERYDRVENVYPHPTKPGTAYAQTSSHMHRTGDYGRSWELFGPRRGQSVREVLFHPHEPGTILARRDDSLWLSDDDGEKWRRVYRRRGDRLLAVMFHESDKDTTYCLHESALLTTKDGGETWSEEALDVDPSEVLCATRSGKPLAVGMTGNRLRIYVPGENPEDITAEEDDGFDAVAVCPTDSSRIAALAAYQHIYVTSDTGQSWRKIRIPKIIGLLSIAFDPRDKNRLLLASSSAGVFEYDLAKEEMKAIGENDSCFHPTSVVASNAGTTLWAGTNTKGVWVYGITRRWKLTNGPYGGNVETVAIHPHDPDIVLVGGPGLMRSEDGGDSWRNIEVPLHYVPSMAFSPSQPETVYAFFGTNTLYASRDAGVTWKKASRVDVRHKPIVVDPFDPKRLFLRSRTLQVSKDGGKVFNFVKDFPMSEMAGLACDLNHKGVVYCHSAENGKKSIAISRDHGETWTKIDPSPAWTTEDLVGYALDPADDSLLLAHTVNTGSGKDSFWFRYEDSEGWEIYYSEDSGIKASDKVKDTLSRLFPPRIDPPETRPWSRRYLWVAPSDPNIAFYGAGFLRRTRDGGKTWEDASKGIGFGDVRALYAHPAKPDSAFCRTEAGLFRTDDLGATWERHLPDRVKEPSRMHFHPLKPDTYFIVDRYRLWMVEQDGNKLREMHSQENDAVRAMVFDAQDPKTFYCYRSKTLMTTTDGGETWGSEPLAEELQGSVRSSSMGDPLVLSYRNDRLRVYVPGKEGKEINLESIKELEKNFQLQDASICPTDSVVMAFCTETSVCYSSDAGETWERREIPETKRRSHPIKGGFCAGGNELDMVRFSPRDKNLMVIAVGCRGIWAYDVATRELTCHMDPPSHNRLDGLAISPDGKTLWAGVNGEGVWVHRQE